MRTMRTILQVALLALIPACVTSHAALIAGGVPREARPAEAVAFYAAPPERPHTALALIEVRAPMGTAAVKLIEEARAKAAELGADAIIAGAAQTEQISPGGGVMLPMPGQGPIAVATGPGGARVLYATAIVWR